MQRVIHIRSRLLGERPACVPFATLLASPFGSIEPSLTSKEHSHDRSAQTPTRHLWPSR